MFFSACPQSRGIQRDYSRCFARHRGELRASCSLFPAAGHAPTAPGCLSRWRGEPGRCDAREDGFSQKPPGACPVRGEDRERTVVPPGDTTSHSSSPVTGGCPATPVPGRSPQADPPAHGPAPQEPRGPAGRGGAACDAPPPTPHPAPPPAGPRARPPPPGPGRGPFPGAERGRRGRAAAPRGRAGPRGAGGESAVPPAAEERRRAAGAAGAAAAAAGAAAAAAAGGAQQGPRRGCARPPAWPGSRQGAPPARPPAAPGGSPRRAPSVLCDPPRRQDER